MCKELIELNKAWIDETFEKLNEKLIKVAVRSREKLPYSTDGGVHTERKPYWWTNGFWGGLMCLMYEATKNEEYKKTSECAEQLLDKAFSTFNELHHDVGFMWHLTSVARYRLFNDEQSKNRGLIASAILASRYNFEGKYIRAWNGIVRGDDSKGLTIIDTMLNLPLLYWASEVTGDDKYKKIAVAQSDMTMRDHVREDGSVCHVVVHDPVTGEKIAVRAGQGYSKDSAWSRGQGWAVYGFILSYIYTKEEKYLKVAKKVADFFIEKIKNMDWVPRVDLLQPTDPEFFDMSAGAIAACGLIELSKHIKSNKEEYLSAAINILREVERNSCDFSLDTDGVLYGSSESYAGGRHKNIVYGDFFFAEAILKLKGREFLIW